MALVETLADSRVTDAVFPRHWSTMLSTTAFVTNLLIRRMSKIDELD